jgi:TolA-binding protein
VVWVFVLGLSGCGEDPKQLFETAQFEEQQNNKAHARELYERIVQIHPESDWANQAKGRLAELEKEKVLDKGKLDKE